MALDQYQQCPCGLGKKIKFCCKDLLSDLDKISNLIEANQRKAALEYIDRLLVKHPDRQSLHAQKVQLLMESADRTESATAIEAFLKAAPLNPIALASRAIEHAATVPEVAADGTVLENNAGKLAVESLQKAMSQCTEVIPWHVFQAIRVVAQRLLQEGKTLAAAEHLRFMAGAGEDFAEDELSVLSQLMRAPHVTLLLKGRMILPDCPEGVEWKPDYDAAIKTASRGAWAEAAKKLTRLASETPGEPLLREAVAYLRCRLGDEQKAVTALRRFAAMDGVDEDKAISAEALAQTMDHSDTDEESSIKLLQVTYEVDDVESAMEKLLSDDRFVSVEFQSDNPDEPPPKAVFGVMDRPMPNAADATYESIPRRTADLFVFGKQTDRSARLELAIMDGQPLETTEQILAEIIGSEMLGKRASRQQRALRSDIMLWDEPLQFPDDLTAEQHYDIVQQKMRTVLFQRWPSIALTLLEGKTPIEAVNDNRLRRRVQGAILGIESQQRIGLRKEDYQELREKIGLPQRKQIETDDLAGVAPADLSRVDVSNLDPQSLLFGLQFALSVGARDACRRFGEELLEKEPAGERRAAIRAAMSSSIDSPKLAITTLHTAIEETEAAGKSPAPLLINELRLRAAWRESDEFMNVLDRIRKRHLNEPGVQQQLVQVLTSLGMIHPDGSSMPEAQPAMAGASAPPTPPQESGLWTPEGSSSAASQADSEGKETKLWVPGMD